MAIIKKSELDTVSLTTNPAKSVSIKFRLSVIEDGEILASKLLRTTIDDGADIPKALTDVSIGIVELGYSEPTEMEIDYIKDVVQLAWPE